MAKPKTVRNVPETIPASPTKRFFVEMLTRDIDLDDAILDLLDNCIDGILRSTAKAKPKDAPYDEFWAHIELTPKQFKIADNCGGIDLETAKTYAFMMGRPPMKIDAKLPTVGMYGIGMKRAIFKMGRKAAVKTNTGKDCYEVQIPSKWLSEEGNWDLPIQLSLAESNVRGTEVCVQELLEDVKKTFAPARGFAEALKAKIATHYSFILNKGFTVTVNGQEVTPRPLSLLMTPRGTAKGIKSDTIAPYMYSAEIEGVSVSLYVGLYASPPSDEDDDRASEPRHNRDHAGWTVICNDRVVIYCDKTRLTGWGEADVPSFHPQFNAISGFVVFRSNDALKLPITTTKRGINAESNLYLYIKDFMREGMKIFTSYTNRWKTNTPGERKKSGAAKSMALKDLERAIPDREWKPVRPKPGIDASRQRKYSPQLPTPSSDGPEMRFIRYSRPMSQIRQVSEYLFETPDQPPSEVGERCFVLVHEECEGREQETKSRKAPRGEKRK